MTTADHQQLPRMPGTFRFSLRGLMLLIAVSAIVFAAGHYFGDVVYIAFGLYTVLLLLGFAIGRLTCRWRSRASGKARAWSLSGIMAIMHLSLFVAAVCYHRSLAGPDGTVFVDDAMRPKLEFFEHMLLIATFPIGWLGLTVAAKDPNAVDLLILVGFVAVNSAVVGLLLAGFIQFSCRRACRKVDRSPPEVSLR